jgi:hypothetical protein
MKSLLLAMLAFDLLAAPTPQSSRQPSEGIVKRDNGLNGKETADGQNQQQAAEAETLKAILAAIAKDQQGRADDQIKEASRENDTVKAEWWLVYVGIAQAIALGFTLVAIGYQAWQTRIAAEATRDAAVATQGSTMAIERQVGVMERQTKATEGAAVAAKESADAALLNAQAVINSERAWLIPAANAIEPNELPNRALANSSVEKVRVRIENCGRTPAWLMDWFVEAVVLDDTNISQFTNAGQPEGDFPNARPFPHGRTEDFAFEWTTNNTEIAAVKSGKKHLYIHGFVQYRSLTGDDPCISRFCFHYFYKRNVLGRLDEGWAAEPPGENHYT